MRFLLDTNILIPLEDSQLPLVESLANFVRLANEHGHQLVYHPSSEVDIRRDTNAQRRQQTLERLRQYSRLENPPESPWNRPGTSENDVADNNILYALQCDAVHALVTEDQGMHKKARTLGLSQNVYAIQTVEDWLRRLYERTSIQLPNIEDVFLYSLSPYLESDFFNSLRDGYPLFNDWFGRKARENNKAWVAWEQPGIIGAICIYVQQDNETITEEGLRLGGSALKLSTFKVAQGVRGKKIGELFLKAAFRYATANRLEHIFIHGDKEKQPFLFDLLEDFGFHCVGTHPGSAGRDAVYLKRHPGTPPPVEIATPFDYMKDFFPHFRYDEGISKFVVPIQPGFHRTLFPDYVPPWDPQLRLFPRVSDVGNAIKLAYLCHAQRKGINKGDIVVFYRSKDGQCLTSIGVVESYETILDAGIIARRVKRRTVYSMDQIEEKAKKPTKVMLFRLVGHMRTPLSLAWLKQNGVLTDRPQSITKITNKAFELVLAHGR